jgi:hypothetical protein
MVASVATPQEWKKKPWPGYMKLNIYKFSYHISMDS